MQLGSCDGEVSKVHAFTLLAKSCKQVQMQARNKLLLVVKAALINLPPLGSRQSPVQTCL